MVGFLATHIEELKVAQKGRVHLNKQPKDNPRNSKRQGVRARKFFVRKDREGRIQRGAHCALRKAK